MSLRIINDNNFILKDEQGSLWEYELAREEPINSRIEVNEEIAVEYDIEKMA